MTPRLVKFTYGGARNSLVTRLFKEPFEYIWCTCDWRRKRNLDLTHSWPLHVWFVVSLVLVLVSFICRDSTLFLDPLCRVIRLPSIWFRQIMRLIPC
jgi:hypothetical protein